MKLALGSIVACGAILTFYICLLLIIDTGGFDQFEGVIDYINFLLIFLFMEFPYVLIVIIFRSAEITIKNTLIMLLIVVVGLWIQYPVISWAHLEFLLILGPVFQLFAIWIAKLTGLVKIAPKENIVI